MFLSLERLIVAFLAAFHIPFGQSTSHPTRLDGPDSTSRSPVVLREPTIPRGDTPDRFFRIENPPSPAIDFAIHDIEAAEATLHSPRATPRSSLLSNEVLWNTNLVSPPQPVEISIQTMIACGVSPVTQPDAGNLPRKQKIMSYSSPIWATFGAQQQNNTGAPSRPQITIEFTRSPTSSSPSLEQGGRVHPSPSSTILGSDIIRVSHYGRDRMRIRHSVPSSAFSPTSPISSVWQRATHQSRASMLSAQPPIIENAPQSGPTLPKEAAQPLGPMSSRSSKSRRGSNSSRSFRSSKSSRRSAKIAVVSAGEGTLRRSAVFRASMVSSRQSRGFPAKTRHTRPAGVVRGPRPSPSASRTGAERSSEGQ